MKRDLSQYRACVGVCLFNSQGRVWLGRRYGETGQHSWQFPQGGLDKGESYEFGALRELWEETGITVAHITPLGHIDKWLCYDYPLGVAPKKGKHYPGQKQRWFAYRFHGDKSDFNLTTHEVQEFSEWKWAKLHKTPEKIIPFKRSVYDQLAVEFSRFAKVKS